MSKQKSKKEYDFKAAKELFEEYLEKGKKKTEIILPKDTV